MIHPALCREVFRRWTFHAQTGGMLNGLKITKSGEFRIEGYDDLPQLSMIDLSGSDTSGKSGAQVSCFLRTARRDDWFKLTDDGRNGLIDWLELILDATETMPSDGKPDQLFRLHNEDGTLYKDAAGQSYDLLIEPFRWEWRMAEINDLAFTMQMDLSYTIASTKRGTRRKQAIPAS